MDRIVAAEDGVTHINIYSKGATELGRWLSNFAHSPFTHPIFGEFASMEAYWYYIKTGFQHNELRPLHGHSAKAVGKRIVEALEQELESTYFPHFEAAILDGIRCKLRQNYHFRTMLTESVLPLTHYYAFNGHVVLQPQHQWQVDELERLRSLLHEHRK